MEGWMWLAVGVVIDRFYPNFVDAIFAKIKAMFGFVKKAADIE